MPRIESTDTGIAKRAPISAYVPEIGDTIIKLGMFFGSQYGIVTGFQPTTRMVSIVFENIPSLLVTLNESEQIMKTVEIDLAVIRTNKLNGWTAIKFDIKNGAPVWYV